MAEGDPRSAAAEGTLRRVFRLDGVDEVKHDKTSPVLDVADSGISSWVLFIYHKQQPIKL